MLSEDHRAAVALKAVRSIWNVHEKLLKPRGIDVHKTSREWTEKQRQRLPCPGARTDFGELCGAGCAAPVLMGVMALLGQSPRMEISWRTMMVTRRKRQHSSRTLTKAADILRSAFDEYISLEDDRLKTIFEAFNRTPISRLVEELRIYGEFFEVIEHLSARIEARSLKEFSRFLLTAYVKQCTREYRDRNVSAILAEMLGPTDYNEVAQRMWRRRNFKRLHRHHN